MNLFKDFADFIVLLKKHNVQYLIVGGYAIGAHSRSRITQDIDFWIKPSKDNAERILLVLKEFGFESGISADELVDPSQLIQFGKPPLRIDILSSVDGVLFEEAYKNRFIAKLGPVEEVNFISYNDLIKNKQASNRTKDHADIEWLKSYGKDSKKI